MSKHRGTVVQLGLWPEYRPTAEEVSAAIRRSLVGLLTIQTGKPATYGISSSGLSHMVGVMLLEMEIMARGKGKGSEQTGQQALPRFVDIKLSHEDRADFLSKPLEASAIVMGIQQIVFEGYRVGCAWSGEHQSFTVSLTCRDEGNPNNGLCFTSFAKELHLALALMLYKHHVVSKCVWLGDDGSDDGMFG